MKKLLIIIILLMPLFCNGQIVKNEETFTTVYTFENKVVFLKEIALIDESANTSYLKLKAWAKENYGDEPFISSVRYDAKNTEIIAKSRVELLLPPNAQNVREKVIMRYRINAFIFQDKCIMEVKSISYVYNPPKNQNLATRTFQAEDMITDEAIAINDSSQELRINTRKSTLYFLNELRESLKTAITQ